MADGHLHTCKPCAAAYNKALYQANKPAASERMRQWRAKNAEALRLTKRAYYEANKAKIIADGVEDGKRWRDNNREYYLAAQRERRKQPKYKAFNAEAANRRRTAAVFSNRAAVAAIYAEAQFLTAATGIEHHVDHIVPLKNRLVCGLHNEFNLRVIPASENQRKKNKLIEELACPTTNLS